MTHSSSTRYQVHPLAHASNHAPSNETPPPPLIRLKLSPSEQQRLLSSLDSSHTPISIQLAGPNSAIHVGSDSSYSIPLHLSDRSSSSSSELHRVTKDSLHSIGSINHTLHSLSTSSSSTSNSQTIPSHQELALKLRQRREEDEARKRDKAAVLLDPEEQRKLQSKDKNKNKGKSVSRASPAIRSASSTSKDATSRKSSGVGATSSNLLSVGSASSKRASSPSKSLNSKTSRSNSAEIDAQDSRDSIPSVNSILRKRLIQTLASSPLKRKYLASHLDCSDHQILPLLDLVADPVPPNQSPSASQSSGNGSETVYKLKDELFTQVDFSRESWPDYSSIQRKIASHNAEVAFKKIGLDETSEIGKRLWGRLWPEGGREAWMEESKKKVDQNPSSSSSKARIDQPIAENGSQGEKEEDSLEEGEEREVIKEVEMKALPKIRKVSDRASNPSGEVSANTAEEDERTDHETIEKKKRAKSSTHDRLRKATKNRNASSSSSLNNKSTSKVTESGKKSKTNLRASSASSPSTDMIASTSSSSHQIKKSRKSSRSVSPPAWLATNKTKKQTQPQEISHKEAGSSSKKESIGDRDARSKGSSSSVSASKKKSSINPSSDIKNKKRGKKLNPRDLDYTDSEDESDSRSQNKSGNVKSNKRVKQESDSFGSKSRLEKSTASLVALDQKSSKIKNENKIRGEGQKAAKNVEESERGRTKERINQRKTKDENEMESSRDNYSREGGRSRSYSRSISFNSREGSFSSLEDTHDDRSIDSRRSVSGNSSSSVNSLPNFKRRSMSKSSVESIGSILEHPSERSTSSSAPFRPPGPGVSIQSNNHGDDPPWLFIKSSSDYTRLVERFLKTFQEYRILKAKCEKEKEMLLMEESMIEVESERENRESVPEEDKNEGKDNADGKGKGKEGSEGTLGNGDFLKIENQGESSRMKESDSEVQDGPDVKCNDALQISTSNLKTDPVNEENPDQRPPSSPEEGEMTPQMENQAQFQPLPESISRSNALDSNLGPKFSQDDSQAFTTDQRVEGPTRGGSQSPPAVWRVVPPLIEDGGRRLHPNHFDHYGNPQVQSRPMGYGELKELVEETKNLFGQLKKMRETLLEHKAKNSTQSQ